MTDAAIIEQGTDAWLRQRLGKVTASRIADLLAKTKSGWGASRKNYAAQIIAERLTGEVAESFINAAMQWGTDQEPNAARAYCFHMDVDVATVGFVDHPTIHMSGASPDRLVGKDGLVEIKAPNTATHLDTLEGAPIDRKYILQMQWQMACTKRAWCDFVSYDPRLPEVYAFHVQRVERDDVMIREIEGEVKAFLNEIAERETRLRRKFEPANVLMAG